MKKVLVNDKMQQDYVYYLEAPLGSNFDPAFKPELTPKEMLALGVFGGKYLNDCQNEFPADWYIDARLSPVKKDISLNFFSVDASQPLSEWLRKGWIHAQDPRGWFQWYCRYYMGRRTVKEDARQIKRWRAFRRHLAAVKKNCERYDVSCRRKQKQALLHWAYDAREL
jgi:ribosomal protein L35